MYHDFWEGIVLVRSGVFAAVLSWGVGLRGVIRFDEVNWG